MQHYQSELDSLQDKWPDEPQALLSLRTKAFSRFTELGFPTRKWEDWQFTDFSPFNKTAFRMTTKDDLRQAEDYKTQSIGDGYSIVILNGHFQPERSTVPEGVTIRTLLDVFLNDDSIDFSLAEENPFVTLNTSLMNSGIAIDIAEGIIVDKPIQYQFITNGITDAVMNHPRLLIRLGKNSFASIIEHYKGYDTHCYWNNCVTISELDQNSSLNHYRIQEDTGYHIGNMEYHLQKDSSLNATYFNIGTKLYRGDVFIHFHGQNASAELYGLSLLNKKQHMDTRVVVDHQYPHCNSYQFFKYILDDYAGGVFNGKVIVRENSQKTDSSQTNKNLLLSQSASMHSNPQLEIHADDVRCSHGSTTGQLNEEALYYLRSRGIDTATAQKLMVEGFASDVFAHIKNKALSAYLNEKLISWLKGLDRG
ncbi:MAG: Fe-S cluster assembly protein SufD [Candidatus Marinimicrobia bacterium]|nr:Fe-S cluster assembly protein SufD [Candidatus Neomarinimicrobiota bacterium]